MASSESDSYTTSTAFFEAIWDAGITHVFVNLGSDHPSIMEAIVRGQRDRKDKFPRIITCPNEMVAMCMADGMARLTRKPQCVIVHVDVGTQGLAGAVHNASCGRAPILIFAGLTPFTIEGEYRGSRTEYIQWVQDVPDQKAIVAQYCRYTGEIKGGRNVKQMVNRALQFATSDPAGPVYLYSAREPMEEEIEPYTIDQSVWQSVAPAALPQSGVQLIAAHLTAAERPMLIVGYTGRNAGSVEAAVLLADAIPSLKVLDTGGSDMCFPANHPASVGFRLGVQDDIRTADFILVIDCDVPWIPTQCKPASTCKIIHIDVDPLKQQMPVHYIPAFARYKADSETALTQIVAHIASNSELKTTLSDELHMRAKESRQHDWEKRQKMIQEAGRLPETAYETSPINVSLLAAQIRASVPHDTIFAIEAVTNAMLVSDQLGPVKPKTWLNSGAAGLGWSGGAALGIKLAADLERPVVDAGSGSAFVCQIVGDGSYIFSVPSSVYWISQRYSIPILTVVLNNKGWNAPRNSVLLVHPHGAASKVDNRELNISFEETPDYAGIARAASGGKVWAGCVSSVKELLEKLPEAVNVVKGGVAAVLEVKLNAKF